MIKYVSALSVLIFTAWSACVLMGVDVIDTASRNTDKWSIGLLLMVIAIRNAADLIEQYKAEKK